MHSSCSRAFDMFFACLAVIPLTAPPTSAVDRLTARTPGSIDDCPDAHPLRRQPRTYCGEKVLSAYHSSPFIVSFDLRAAIGHSPADSDNSWPCRPAICHAARTPLCWSANRQARRMSRCKTTELLRGGDKRAQGRRWIFGSRQRTSSPAKLVSHSKPRFILPARRSRDRDRM
jgi:hypothetical protein